jgi:hypothetical protein
MDTPLGRKAIRWALVNANENVALFDGDPRRWGVSDSRPNFRGGTVSDTRRRQAQPVTNE